MSSEEVWKSKTWAKKGWTIKQNYETEKSEGMLLKKSKLTVINSQNYYKNLLLAYESTVLNMKFCTNTKDLTGAIVLKLLKIVLYCQISLIWKQNCKLQCLEKWKNRKHSLLYSLQWLVQCVNPSLHFFVPVWASHLLFSCSETCWVYLFIHFPLITALALTNTEVVALAPSLHPPSPDCRLSGCRSRRKKQALGF